MTSNPKRDTKSQSDVARRLQELVEKFPLADGWTLEEPFIEVVELEGIAIRCAGLVASLGSTSVIGSAASADELPLERAYFELVERSATLEAMNRGHDSVALLDLAGRQVGEVSGNKLFLQSPEPDAWQYSRSNGIALQRSFSAATEAAWLELVERDRVLRSWFGLIEPRPAARPTYDWALALSRLYEFQTFLFPDSTTATDLEVTVAGTFAFPRSLSIPLVYGFGAALRESEAFLRAGREMLQRLGFLWGEAIPTQSPEPVPDPGFHQEFYLCPSNHEKLHGWLRGDHLRYGSMVSMRNAQVASTRKEGGPHFAELSPTRWNGSLSLVKAVGSSGFLLTFGRKCPWLDDSWSDLAIHPIT